MFKKIVSNLPFSPALVGQLGFYAKRLRREKTTRQLALIFVVLALIIQSLALFQPATSANASSLNDMVDGGLGQSLNNFLTPYNSNTRNLKDIMNYVGITKEEIAAAKYSSWKADNKIVWGLVSRFSYDQGERQFNITSSDDKQTVSVYSRPLNLSYGSNVSISGWIGNSKKAGWFAIMQNCGNLVTDNTPTPISPSTSIIKSEIATNTSQGFVDATKTIANAGDQISYTITVTNLGQKVSSTKLENNMSDVLDYASIIDNGGGTLDSTTNILSWPDITLSPKETQTRTIVIRLLDSIPATAQGSSDPSSYDCSMTNVFGNSLNINVDCPTPKIIETIAKDMPKTGWIENLIFSSVILILSAYFFARTRQLEKEIRLIRKNINTGTI